MKKSFILFFLFLNNLFLFAQPEKYDAVFQEDIFFNFEDISQLWKITSIKNNCVKEIKVSKDKCLGGEYSLQVYLEFPGEGCIEKEFFKDLSSYRNLIFNIFIPSNAPDDLKVCFFLQDNEWLWYQTSLFSLKKEQWNKITLNVEPSSTFWENVGHSQPWSEKTISSIRKIGLKFFSSSKFSVNLYLDEIKGNFKLFPEIKIDKKKINKLEKFEVSFFLLSNYNNPFDPEEISVEGVFIDPDEKVYIIPGFYYQDYERKIENNIEILTPVGYPLWKVRFTPEKEGKYKFFIKLKDKEGERKTDLYYFTVDNGDVKNRFITISDIDRRYFSFKNGEFFYPVGLNIRSPTDERYSKMMQKPNEPDRGTFYYEEMFKKLNENGINFIEIWMAPWFSALEWKENRPGYKGIGYYSLRNAWKIDKILEFAEKYKIYIQLVIINHGQLSTWCDQEWEDNPYNIKNGGFLKNPNEFFTNEKAKKLTLNKLRYIVGRWSYSPYIFSWEILNEINLVGSDGNFYKKPDSVLWFKEMKEYLKKIDPYNRLVTGHYTILVDNEIISEGVDYTITNAYYDCNKQNFPDFLRYIYKFNSKFQKPTFVSEYGGTPWGSSFENLKRDIIFGLWYSFHLPFAGTPLFWWHRFVDEFNLFYLYKIFVEYSNKIDRIKMSVEDEIIYLDGPNKNQIFSIGIGNRFFSSVFLYDNNVTKSMDKKDFPEYRDIICILKDKKIGKFKVEFYHPEKGKIEEKEIMTDENGNLKIDVLPFKKWISLNIKFNGK